MMAGSFILFEFTYLRKWYLLFTRRTTTRPPLGIGKGGSVPVHIHALTWPDVQSEHPQKAPLLQVCGFFANHLPKSAEHMVSFHPINYFLYDEESRQNSRFKLIQFPPELQSGRLSNKACRMMRQSTST
jgi:hypothetical protein